MRLARILCDNADEMLTVQYNVMAMADPHTWVTVLYLAKTDEYLKQIHFVIKKNLKPLYSALWTYKGVYEVFRFLTKIYNNLLKCMMFISKASIVFKNFNSTLFIKVDTFIYFLLFLLKYTDSILPDCKRNLLTNHLYSIYRHRYLLNSTCSFESKFQNCLRMINQ